jgi:hypothetical protein
VRWGHVNYFDRKVGGKNEHGVGERPDGLERHQGSMLFERCSATNGRVTIRLY